MPPKGQKEIVYPITSEEQFMQIIAPENKKLVGNAHPLLTLLFSYRCASILVWTLRRYEFKLQDSLFLV